MNNKVIHAARIQRKGVVVYLLLKELSPHQFAWFEEGAQTSIEGPTIEDAMQEAKKTWAHSSFRPLNCGFRFTLPERDEHGTTALFHQMVASYNSSSGIYFDEELGHTCIVKNASEEAKSLWKSL